jgi:hypothetical protein
MDWNTLLAVVLGGLIGIVTNYFSNRYQLQRWREEKDEQRREAKIQAKVKWIERDILDIMERVGPTGDGYGLDTKRRNRAKRMVTLFEKGDWTF